MNLNDDVLAAIRNLYSNDELGLLTEVKNTSNVALDSAFIEICEFYEANGRLPVDSDDADIHEMMLGAKFKSIFENETRIFAVKKLDAHGILGMNILPEVQDENEGDVDVSQFATIDALMNSPEFAGIFSDSGADDLFDTSRIEQQRRKPAEDTATRKICTDFEQFKALFDSMDTKIKFNLVHKVRITDDGIHQKEVVQGAWFFVNDQLAYVAEVSEEAHRREHGRIERRLRVIFDNGQESNMLMRSILKMAHADKKALKFK